LLKAEIAIKEAVFVNVYGEVMWVKRKVGGALSRRMKGGRIGYRRVRRYLSAETGASA
jgi:hypothetical protein